MSEPEIKGSPRQTQHLVLARRYRPQKFNEVVEQKMATQALGNAIQHNRLGSGYVFFGPRGVGKTTIARILAKRVNCQNPQGIEPCDECESCVTIRNGNSLDVVEKDGATNRGIDAIRELCENTKFPPMVSHKKVYIIDEVHMLTTEAFNALLKTLEEPPAHILFILATTELNKIPETILSRCQVFHFRKVPLGLVQSYLRDLLNRDGIEADDEALFWIARQGEGSVRDSLSYLEQAITYCDGKLQSDRIRELFGMTEWDLYASLTTSLLDPESTAEKLLAPLHEAFTSGQDLSHFIWEYLSYLRNLNHIKNEIKDPEFLALPVQEIQSLAQQFEKAEPIQLDIIFRAFYDLLARNSNMRLQNSYEQRLLIEMELMALKNKLSQPSLSGILQKLNRFGAALQGLPETETERPVSPEQEKQTNNDPAGPPQAESLPYSPEYEIKKQFLGTVVDANQLPSMEENKQ